MIVKPKNSALKSAANSASSVLIIAMYLALNLLPIAVFAAKITELSQSEREALAGQIDVPNANRTQQSARDRSQRPTEAEALAIAALRALMSAPPERALPLIEKTLREHKSELVKARALFVLGQINASAAQALLLKNAREQTGNLQREAIRSIGISGQAGSLAQLPSLYANGNAELQEAVLNAFLIADDKNQVMHLALTASTPEQRERAMQTLGAMGAVEQLRKLAKRGFGSNALVQAFGIAGDLEGLLKIARTDSNPALRAKAIQSLGIIGTPAATAALSQLYQSAKSTQEKSAALTGMLIANDEAGLLKLYQTSTEPDEKRRILSQLGRMGGDAAMQAIDAALSGQQP